MWQLYANLFFYSFSYYAAKGPLAEVSKDIAVPTVIEKIDDNAIFTAGVMGCLLLGFFQDKIGTRFALNLSQLSSFLIYAIGLLKFEKEIIAVAGPGAVNALKTVPSSAFVLIKVLPILQHSMQLGKAGLLCLSPWDQPMIALGRTCYALVAYAAGLWASALVVDNLALTGVGALTLATSTAFFAWFMNYLSFPIRQRAPAAKAGTRMEDGGSYLSIIIRSRSLLLGYLVIAVAGQVFNKYLGDQTNNAPAFLTSLASKLSGAKVDYLVSPIVALLVIPGMSLFTKTPGGVIRFLFLAASLVVVWRMLLEAKLISPCKCTELLWVTSVVVNRTLYVVPFVYVVSAVIPGTQGQTTALLSVLSGVAGKVTPVFLLQGCDIIKSLMPAIVPFTPLGILTIALLLTAVYVTILQDKSARVRAAKLKKE